MAALLEALASAPAEELTDAINYAAAEGLTSTVETLLGLVVADSPRDLRRAVAGALASARGAGRGETADYLSDFAADTLGPGAGDPAFSLADAVVPSTVRFEEVDPGLPPDAYGGARNPCKALSLLSPALEFLSGGQDRVVPPGALRVRLPAVVGGGDCTVRVPGGTRRELAENIALACRERCPSGRRLADLSLSGARPAGAGCYDAVLA